MKINDMFWNFSFNFVSSWYLSCKLFWKLENYNQQFKSLRSIILNIIVTRITFKSNVNKYKTHHSSGKFQNPSNVQFEISKLTETHNILTWCLPVDRDENYTPTNQQTHLPTSCHVDNCLDDHQWLYSMDNVIRTVARQDTKYVQYYFPITPHPTSLLTSVTQSDSVIIPNCPNIDLSIM